MIPILQRQKLRLRGWTYQAPAIAPKASCFLLGSGQPGLRRGGVEAWPMLAAVWADRLLPIDESPEA